MINRRIPQHYLAVILLFLASLVPMMVLIHYVGDINAKLSTTNAQLVQKDKQIEALDSQVKGLSATLEDEKRLLLQRETEIAEQKAQLQKAQPVSRGGNPDLTNAVSLTATAYTYTGSRTATGTKTKRGTIAVDPKVIPLGTKLYVEGYGYGVAEDTGGAIHGNIIDLYMPTESECIKWGRRTVKVYILN